MPVLECALWVPADIGQVWAFSSDPKNLEILSPPFYGLKVESHEGCFEGSTVSLKMSPMGLPFGYPWISKISKIEADENKKTFCDEQVKGPFKNWKHTHRFERGATSFESQNGGERLSPIKPGTWIYDRVDFEYPFEPLLDPLFKLFAAPQLDRLFAYRRHKLQELFWN